MLVRKSTKGTIALRLILFCPAAGQGFAIDVRDRKTAIMKFYELTRLPYLLKAQCLTLDQFADILAEIKYAILYTGSYAMKCILQLGAHENPGLDDQ